MTLTQLSKHITCLLNWVNAMLLSVYILIHSYKIYHCIGDDPYRWWIFYDRELVNIYMKWGISGVGEEYLTTIKKNGHVTYYTHSKYTEPRLNEWWLMRSHIKCRSFYFGKGSYWKHIAARFSISCAMRNFCS